MKKVLLLCVLAAGGCVQTPQHNKTPLESIGAVEAPRTAPSPVTADMITADNYQKLVPQFAAELDATVR